MIHVLVCDDYEPITGLVKTVLEQYGMKVSTALDGTCALKLANQIRPGLVISDIDMPGISGLCLFKSLQADVTGLAQVPFILMSSIDHKQEALEAGCDLFLTKPFSIKDLRCTVSRALSRSGITPVDLTKDTD